MKELEAEVEGRLGGKIAAQRTAEVVDGQTKAGGYQDKCVERVRLRRGWRSRCLSCNSGGGFGFSRLLIPDLDTLDKRLVGRRDETGTFEDHNVSVRSQILALVLKPKVFGEEMQELALALRRRLVSHTNLTGALGEDTELSFLRLRPAAQLFE
jgi:hypothetical protein